jgi:iron complex transport system substrate-binding protein
MRIVSLLPSATEILCALGLEREVVGVSHECDFPEAVKKKAVVIHSRIPKDASSQEIDRMTREYVSRGESLYSVDAAMIEDLDPDLIVTQDLCHVCAASPDDLAAALRRFDRPPEVVTLNPQTLGEVWRDILLVGEETGTTDRAAGLLEKIGLRLGEGRLAVEDQPERPRVALLEWLQPFYVGGHWVPEMIGWAGGKDVFGKAGKPSFRVTLEEIVAAAPDVILIAPCGYNKERARAEYLSLQMPQAWQEIPAVRNGRVYAMDANSYVSRPGPRLVTGIEAMIKIFHPAATVREKAVAAFERIESLAHASHTASA